MKRNGKGTRKRKGRALDPLPTRLPMRLRFYAERAATSEKLAPG